MFNNIGKKIKGLTQTLFWITTIAYIVSGISLCAIDEDLILIGLPLMIAGPFLSWIGSFFMYGFGELIDKACDIEKNTRGNSSGSTSQPVFNAERIEHLKNLLSRNLITEEEYRQALSRENI